VVRPSVAGRDPTFERWKAIRRIRLATCGASRRSHCHLGLGKLYRRTGKREEAQEHLTTATTLYREMGMGLWPEETAAEMSELN
jgi:hypothetical protein